MESDGLPISFADALAARARLSAHLAPTPLRHYAALDAAVGSDIRVLVKHENHLPTNSFKVRNGLSVLTALSADELRRGVIAASRGNHGQGLAWAGNALGVKVTICVPLRNNPEKNEAMRGLGAELIEQGLDYDDAIAVANNLVATRDYRLVHSTNEPLVIAGAATLSIEILREAPTLDALVVAVGGGSQAVGAIVAARALAPRLAIYAVQAERASAIHDAWHRGVRGTTATADTIADGLATRNVYETTFPALQAGLTGFITVSEAEIADAVRTMIRTTHNLAEGAGAAGLAGLRKLASELAGKTVGIILSGSNIDVQTLKCVVGGEL